jgi:AraC-like DNA-binding protein
LIEYAASRGLSRSELLARAGLAEHEHALLSPDGRVPAQLDDSLWRIVESELGDPDLGLRFSTSEAAGSAAGAMSFLARASANVGQAWTRLVRYYPLITDGARLEFRVEGRRVEVAPVPFGVAWPRAVIEAALGSYRMQFDRWTGGAFSAVEVHFRHRRPERSEAEQLLGCAVGYEQPRDALVFDQNLLELPLLGSDRELLQFLERSAEARLQLLNPVADFEFGLKQAVGSALDAGSASLSTVAKRMGVSVRTLQRKASSRGQQVAELLDRERQARAMALLGREHMSVKEVAHRLGFSDPRAFRRAFRRWTGMAPRELLRAQSAGDDSE